MSAIDSLSAAPKHSIKAVCTHTGIRPVTLRAWERRYNLLTPHRTHSNYRLYSDRDLALLTWLKSRVDSGLSISAAAVELAELRQAGKWPEPIPAHAPSIPERPTAPPSQFADRLFKALTALDETTAGVTLAEALSTFDLTTVCMEVMTPCLVKIGEAWHSGEILISTEHLSSNFIRDRLAALMHSFASRRGAPRIIAACPPAERHEIGIMMLAVLLRREGYRVDYLGTGIPPEDLIDYIRTERPAMVCFSASSAEAARELRRLHDGIGGARRNIRFGYGGQVFAATPALRETTPGVFLGATAAEGVAKIQQMLL